MIDKEAQGILKSYKLVEEMLSLSEPKIDSEPAISSPEMKPSAVSVSILKPVPGQDEESAIDYKNETKSMFVRTVFNIKKDIENIHNICTSEDVDIEPWIFSKLVKAADAIDAISDYLEYEDFKAMSKQCSIHGDEDCECQSGTGGIDLVSKIGHMLAGEDEEVNEQVLRKVIFNIECLKEAKKSKKIDQDGDGDNDFDDVKIARMKASGMNKKKAIAKAHKKK